jgi:hypothetical protein
MMTVLIFYEPEKYYLFGGPKLQPDEANADKREAVDSTGKMLGASEACVGLT